MGTRPESGLSASGVDVRAAWVAVTTRVGHPPRAGHGPGLHLQPMPPVRGVGNRLRATRTQPSPRPRPFSVQCLTDCACAPFTVVFLHAHPDDEASAHGEPLLACPPRGTGWFVTATDGAAGLTSTSTIHAGSLAAASRGNS